MQGDIALSSKSKRCNVFYVPDIVTHPEISGTEYTHCIRVLRKKCGDEINITDGKGNIYKSIIKTIQSKSCKITVLEVIKTVPLWKSKIEIAISSTKNSIRMEWLAEKLTEIGINQISLLKTNYSSGKKIKTDRIKKIMISAMKQSNQTFLPELQEIISFDHFVKHNRTNQKFIAHCHSSNSKFLLSKICEKEKNAVVLIGPEGDFHQEEVRLAINCGFRPVSLGSTRLRTETAAIVACQIIHVINQL